MWLWGLAVLAAHVTATTVNRSGQDKGCLLELVPLGPIRYSCAVLEVSCFQKRIIGTKSELDSALVRFDPLAVQALVFSHCEALTMPPRLNTFPNLAQIKAFNSSIAEWGDDAALTAPDHPKFKALYLAMTNMSRIPSGFFSSTPPPTLNNVQLFATNLTGVPDDLLDKWPTLSAFGLEGNPGITEFPRAVRHGSLPSNNISALPDDVFVSSKYLGVSFSGNLLTRLPAEVGNAPTVVTLLFVSTKIESVPSAWTAASARFIESGSTLFAMDTPLCAGLKEVRAQPPAGDVATTLPWVYCDDISGLTPHFYPIEYEKLWRARNRV